MILLIAFAPARLHMGTSSLVFATSMVTVEALFQKLSFRSFRISEYTSIAREATAFLERPLFSITSLQQLLSEWNVFHACGWILVIPRHSQSEDQTQMEKRHLKRRWASDSCTWLQGLHRPQFCPLRRSSLPIAHMGFWIINQAKALHFGGSYSFQTIVGIVEKAWPKIAFYKPKM
jgi:hypothetical protein